MDGMCGMCRPYQGWLGIVLGLLTSQSGKGLAKYSSVQEEVRPPGRETGGMLTARPSKGRAQRYPSTPGWSGPVTPGCGVDRGGKPYLTVETHYHPVLLKSGRLRDEDLGGHQSAGWGSRMRPATPGQSRALLPPSEQLYFWAICCQAHKSS